MHRKYGLSHEECVDELKAAASILAVLVATKSQFPPDNILAAISLAIAF